MNKFLNSIFATAFCVINDSLKSNDFPMQGLNFTCMSSSVNNRDFMAKCSCAVDEIAKRISYEEYAQAEAIARLWEGASPREKPLEELGYLKRKWINFLKLKQRLNWNVLIISK